MINTTNNNTTSQNTSNTSLLSKLWYWTLGGVWECFLKSYRTVYFSIVEFILSASLVAMGFWLLLPARFTTGMAFVEVINYPKILFGTQVHMPVWIFSIVIIVVGRIALHWTLKGSQRQRARGLLFVELSWGIMLSLNLLTGHIVEGTPFLAFVVIIALLMQLRMECTAKATKRIRCHVIERRRLLKSRGQSPDISEAGVCESKSG